MLSFEVFLVEQAKTVLDYLTEDIDSSDPIASTRAHDDSPGHGEMFSDISKLSGEQGHVACAKFHLRQINSKVNVPIHRNDRTAQSSRSELVTEHRAKLISHVKWLNLKHAGWDDREPDKLLKTLAERYRSAEPKKSVN